MTKKLKPIHPGEILLTEFLEPLDITPYRLAKDIGVPPTRISEIVREKRSITADTALRLSKYFGTSAELWLNLQSHYDLDMETYELEKLKLKIKVLPLAQRKKIKH